MTITIAEKPILVDVDGEAQSWLDRFMPEATIFRPPQVDFDPYLGGLDANGEFFKSSLPDLPPIKIGQIQWPCVGASRFARGLFLVDRIALFEIMHVAWGHVIPTDYPQPIPSSWSQTKNRTVTVFLADGVGEGPPFELYLHVLLPIRVTDDLWILPLVDSRYFRLTDCRPNYEINPEAPTKTWQDLFDGYANNDGLWSYYVDYSDEELTSLGRPDPVFYKPNVPNPFPIDAACFSLGCRPVVPYPTEAEVDYDFPKLGTLHVECQLPSVATTRKATTLANDKITGGTSGAGRNPKSLHIVTSLSTHFYIGDNQSYFINQNLAGTNNGSELYSRAVWQVLQDEPSTETAFANYYVEISAKINQWNIDEYYVVFPDLIYLDPSGFDDYIIFESSGDKKTTTVRSLPIDFMAPYLLGQAQSGPGFDTTAIQTKWFRTTKQTVQGKLINGAAAGGVTSGFRNQVLVEVQIIDMSLLLPPVGSAPRLFAKAKVKAVNAEARALAGATIVHLVWMDSVLWNSEAGSGVGAAIGRTGWTIDWADC